MFVKRHRNIGWSSYLPWKNIFILKQKLSNLYIIIFSVSENENVSENCIYAHCSSMRSQMLYPHRRFEICQVRIFVKQRRTRSWSSYLSWKKCLCQSKNFILFATYVLTQWKVFWLTRCTRFSGLFWVKIA